MGPATRLFRTTGFILFICAIAVSCSTPVDIHKRPLYSINKYHVEDNVRRAVFREQLLIAKELDSIFHAVVTLEKYVQLGRTVYSLDVYYAGPDWRHMEDIILSIEGETTILTDANPVRIRKSGDTVIESLTCLLDRDTFIGLRYCKSLVIQYYHNPISIPQAGLEAIWNFLRE